MITTEQNSHYDHLESMPIAEILTNINKEDQLVALAIQQKITAIQKFVESVMPNMKNGGRLFYIGAGTSGRMGILDASECPPTYGVPPDLVIGIIAGGDVAIKSAVENAEDDFTKGKHDLENYFPSEIDSIVGIAASGTTPYVIGAIEYANELGMQTACITCNEQTPLAKISKFPIEVVVGPEFVTGSTRMKAGSAQKMVLNMISTTLMIQLGRVKGNKMVDMQLTNNKLVDRAIKMVQQQLGVDQNIAKGLLTEFGSVRSAVEGYKMQ